MSATQANKHFFSQPKSHPEHTENKVDTECVFEAVQLTRNCSPITIATFCEGAGRH